MEWTDAITLDYTGYFTVDVLSKRGRIFDPVFQAKVKMLADQTDLDHTPSPELDKECDVLIGSANSSSVFPSGAPEQNHEDVTTRTRSRTRAANSTDVHYHQNAGWTVKTINFPPLF